MGERIASYTVTGTLGRGGYGEVLAAVHDVIGRDVAIKVLHAKWSDDPEAVRRFVAEARAVNAVRHPNIVDVVDFGTLDDGRHYHVMERLAGETLRGRLEARSALPVAEAVPILRAIASALDAAHDAGIVHRDVKPENVFLHQPGDIVKLIDFGLAKLATVTEAPTQSGVIMGTPAYMAPEQCRGQPVDRRTDAYAFGVIAYEILTGEVPLKGADPVATLLAHVHDAAVPLSRRAGLPRAIDAIVMPLLAKSPAARPDRLGPVVDALEAGGSPRTRRRALWLGLAGLVLAGGGVAIRGALHDEPAVSAAPPTGVPPPPIATSAPAPTPPMDAEPPADAGIARVHKVAPPPRHVPTNPEALEVPDGTP